MGVCRRGEAIVLTWKNYWFCINAIVIVSKIMEYGFTFTKLLSHYWANI